MATPKETIWEIDNHTLAKHDILRRYLNAWFPILGKAHLFGNAHWPLLYIDGFSGPGIYKSGNKGSPIIALESAIANVELLRETFVNFCFVEENKDRAVNLQQEIRTLQVPGNFKISLNLNKFNDAFLNNIYPFMMSQKGPMPTFAFIDPFGISGVPFDIIIKLLSRPSCEVFITFMHNAINRWLALPNNTCKSYIQELFGTDSCFTIAHEKGDRKTNLRMLYQRQLKEVAGARYVRYFTMINDNNQELYDLFFAGNNLLGFVRMKEVMWKVDNSGQFSYSDTTDDRQVIMFCSDHSNNVCELLLDRYSGKKGVLGKAIREYLENDTIYLKKHMTQALTMLERDERLFVEKVKSDGKKRVRGYPDKVIIHFR